MKFIHTADWHLGNRMHDIERNEEFKSFLSWLKNVIVEEKAEGLIVSGDIFDTANPPTESRRQYIKFLASLLDTCCRNVIVVGGNHDSGALLDSEKDILAALDIHVVGSISNIRLEDMVFELKDDNDDASAICVAIPFVRENDLRDYFDEEVEDGCFSDQAYGALYNKALEIAKKMRGDRQIPIIATGHLYAANLEGRFSAAEKESGSDDGRRILDVVGKLGSVHASVFSPEYDYVALGHIHYTTMVDKNPKVRYSGSPFILGFDEAHLDRNVLSVNVEKGKKPEVNKIAVPRTVEYRRISGDCETIRKELEKYHLKEADGITGKYMESHLELYYKREDGININDELEGLITELKEKEVYVASRRVQDVGKIMNGENPYCDDMDELKNMAPEEIFKALLLSKSPIDLGEMEEDMTDEEKDKKIREKQDEIVKKYLPTFMEIYSSVQNGDM
ncbi:exonuclease subunit SbcD [Treponema sp.]|uniref:exonuclease subunit SbcD n=1 Tax=Treponema sp. TaxID=166 RepID=UPI00298DB03C|nr:exonuclease subunit SbcD [Treponema sp.]MCQ2241681.1 exonuclease subunit SbcD [Treponema sp.]